MSFESAAMIIFDDARGRLGPMTDLRSAFEVRTGLHTTARRIVAGLPRRLAGYHVPAGLAAVVAARADAPVNEMPNEEALLCVNGRLALIAPYAEVGTLPILGEAIIEAQTGDIVLAALRRADAEYFLRTGELGERVRRRETEQRVLYRHPWDVIAMLEAALREDLSRVVMPDSLVARTQADVIGEGAIDIEPSARIMPGVVFDAEAGPILVGARAVLRPGAVICGPAAILADATVMDRAVVRAGSVVGPGCKVAGELSMSVFQGRANKAHEGFLGHSWVGKWANLGAGTTTSNLLNTYGSVSMRVDPAAPRMRTGQTFLGSIIGDHVKTAICTRLMTGTCIGTGAMIAVTASPPDSVGRFAWMTDDGTRLFRLDRFLEIMQTVMGRRGITPDAAYVEAVRSLHGRTEAA